jgi:hypothetical protein
VLGEPPRGKIAHGWFGTEKPSATIAHRATASSTALVESIRPLLTSQVYLLPHRTRGQEEGRLAVQVARAEDPHTWEKQAHHLVWIAQSVCGTCSECRGVECLAVTPEAGGRSVTDTTSTP